MIVPGADPLGAIDHSGGDPGAPVVVIDQFEELFALDTPDETAHEFWGRVAEHAGAETRDHRRPRRPPRRPHRSHGSGRAAERGCTSSPR